MAQRHRLALIGIVIASIPIAAATASEPRRPLTLEVIFSPDETVRVDFSGAPVSGLTWSADGRHFLRPVSEGEAFRPPLLVAADGGGDRPLFDERVFAASLSRLPSFTPDQIAALPATAVSLSPAHDAVLIRHLEALFHYRWEPSRAVRLTDDEEVEELAAFSPDGRWVSYVRDHDLWVVEVDGQRPRPLTRGGGPDLLHGKLDWIYQEELYGRGDFTGYWWSPDSTRIAFLELDESRVAEHTLVDHLSIPARTEIAHYPLAGEPNPEVRLGVVRVDDAETVWIDTSHYAALDHLIVRVGWTPASDQVVFLVQDREQTWVDVGLGDPGTGASRRLLRETSSAFIDIGLYGPPHWLQDGSFLWLSGRTGYPHLYHFGPDGALRRRLTEGDWEVRQLYGIDEDRGWVYLAASERSPTETHIYRVRLDGTDLQPLSRRTGTHAASFDPTFSRYLDTWSDLAIPPRVAMFGADGTEERVVDANPVAALDEYLLGQVELVQVPAPDGFVMEALLIKPPDFDPRRRYPVLQYNYGGPHAPVVRRQWAGARNLWHHYLAARGFIVWMCDNRSASGKGIAPTWEAHGRLGEVELRDIEAGVAWLRSQPWVDPERIGIWGGSYGGYLAAYALTHSASFKVGIALSPVTDWRLYDSIYTERYMRTPQSNPDGYRSSSVVHAAGDLRGRLLLIHGTLDDNVHLQNSLQLAWELQRAGQSFELMLYPGERHRISEPALVYHQFRLMTQFLEENL